MFSEPEPTDLIIGCVPVRFPALANMGQTHLPSKEERWDVESDMSQTRLQLTVHA